MKLNKLALVLFLMSAQASAAVVTRHPVIEKTVTVGTSTTQYTSGDVMGIGGASVLTGVAFEAGSNTMLKGVSLTDVDATSGPMDLFFFNTNPTSVASDNAAFVVNDPDLLTFEGQLNVPVTAFASLSGASVATVKDIQLPMKTNSSTGSLYVVAVTRSTPLFVGASSLKIKLLFEQQ